MKRHAIIVGAVTILVLFSMVGCGGKSELSRSNAGKLIQASDKFTPGEYHPLTITMDQLQGGIKQGFWEQDRDARLSLTPKGQTYFEEIGGMLGLVSKPLPRRVIEVTGVADGPSPATTKEVQFTWKWDFGQIPNEVKSFLGPEPKPSEGAALLKLYDDGWRVEELRVQ